jgi:ubiquinone/menaquinone biosynthesis C-methylase UbiE
MITTQDAAAETGYALDSAWYAERERLDSLTRLYDPSTLEICERIGVSDGWRCLDAGAGTGSLAQALLILAAPTGSVTALDLDTRFLDPIADDHLEVLAADITKYDIPAAQFDLVHARLLLEHLPERTQVLARLVNATKPGGWLLIEDFDWATAFMVDPPSPVHQKVAGAIHELFTRHGYLPSFGRTLPRQLEAAGLRDISTRAQAIQVRSDPKKGLPQWELLAQQLAPGLLANGLVTEQELSAFHELWHDGQTVCFSPLMISSWGRRTSR